MILVAGEALVDLIVEPSGALTAHTGGGPYNAARTLGRLGAPVAYVGRLSSDAFGRRLRAGLEADGVRLAVPHPTEQPTTLAVAELDEHGAATYRFYLEGTSAAGLVDGDVEALPASLDAVHVGTLGLVLEPTATTLERLVHRLPMDVLVMLDPNCRPAVPTDAVAYRNRLDRLLARADVVKVSGDDLAYLFPGVDARDGARSLLGHGPSVVLLTDGAAGVHVLTARGEHTVPAHPVRVVDTVGAGDAFGGAFLAAWTAQGLGRGDLVRDDDVRRCVAAAAVVASVTCERRGADPPRLGALAATSPAAYAVLSGVGGQTG